MKTIIYIDGYNLFYGCLKHSRDKWLDVWKLEEKQTDVNIALTAYRDAARSDVEQLVFVSNDTDLEPALAAIREDFGNRHIIGLILPMRKTPAGIHHRAGNQRLSALADWTRRYLTDEELAAAQLPVMIPTQKKPIRKPAYW